MTPKQSSGPPPPSKLGDTLFSIAHLLALIAVFLYGVVALVRGNRIRFFVVIGGLLAYYLLVLHKPVRKEIARRRAGRTRP